MNEADGFTTLLAQLEAVALEDPIHLGYGKACSISNSVACSSELDRPVGEECLTPVPVLTFKQQISLVDHRILGGGQVGYDRGVVQAQLSDAGGGPIGPWMRLEPFLNPYDTVPDTLVSNCTFDPIDDGNTEDDLFDPPDPDLHLGPSSTCFPLRDFVHQGDVVAFDPSSIGDAADGPGLEGESGPGTWVEVGVDLSRFVGRSLRVRFLTTGIKVGGTTTWWQWGLQGQYDDGWWIDDLTVTDTLTTAATLTVDENANLDIKDDGDLDGVGGVCDCDPGDEAVWTIPGEAGGLTLSHAGGSLGTTTPAWGEPTDPGAAAVSYDILRSPSPGNFDGAATCVGTDLPATTTTDTSTPPPGTPSYFLVRGVHAFGPGTLGVTSQGPPRLGRSCP